MYVGLFFYKLFRSLTLENKTCEALFKACGLPAASSLNHSHGEMKTSQEQPQSFIIIQNVSSLIIEGLWVGKREEVKRC